MISAKIVFLAMMSINEESFSYSHLDQKEAYCLAEAVYREARSESVEGQVAVANSILSRVNHPRFPGTVCAVVRQKNAFSWYHTQLGDLILDGPLEIKSFRLATVISLMKLNGELTDFCKGAIFFYNPGYSNPVWLNKHTTTCVIGSHIFKR